MKVLIICYLQACVALALVANQLARPVARIVSAWGPGAARMPAPPARTTAATLRRRSPRAGQDGPWRPGRRARAGYAVRRFVVSPMQLGGTRRNVHGWPGRPGRRTGEGKDHGEPRSD